MSQFDKDDVEAVGLVKFDFLGLRNLTIIELALEYVSASPASARPDGLGLKIRPPTRSSGKPTPRRSSRSESEGMKKLLKLAPDRFEDIIAVLALYRPGPLGSGMVDDFIPAQKASRPSTTSTRISPPACRPPTG